MILNADGPAVRILWSIDCNEACVTAAVRTSLILAMSTLALFSCRAVCSAGRSWRSRVGSWRSGGAGDWRTGDTGTVEADEPAGPDEGFKLPELDDDDDVDEDWDCVVAAAVGFSTWADLRPVKPGAADACIASLL